MPKMSNSFDEYDDVSIKPITAEGKVLSAPTSELDDQKVKNLLAELDAIDAANSPIPINKSYSPENTTQALEYQQVSEPSQQVTQPVQENTEETSQGKAQEINPTDKPVKKYSPTPVNENSNSSMLKVALILIGTLLLGVGAIVHNVWQYSISQESASVSDLPITPGEQFADVSDEAANFVKNSNSKLPGSTIEQALGNYLNSSVGQNWQALGWKSEFEQGTSYSVIFVWKEGNERKQALWQLDLKTKVLTPKSFIAEAVTPVNTPEVNNNNTQGNSQDSQGNNQDNSQPTK